MTVHIPKPNRMDKLLRSCGKPRAVIIPEDVHDYHGKEKDLHCRKEGLWTSLRRPRGEPLPNDRADIFLLRRVYGNSGPAGKS